MIRHSRFVLVLALACAFPQGVAAAETPATLNEAPGAGTAAAVPVSAVHTPAAFDAATARRITPEDVQRRRAAGEKAIILDTRNNLGDDAVAGATLVRNDDVETWAKGVPRDTLIITYCT
jgi:hypothetical protein